MITIIGTVAPIPVTVTVTGISLLVWTILHSFVIPDAYHVLGNMAMVGVPMMTLLAMTYVYAISIIRSPLIRAMYSGSEDIDPSIIIGEVSNRSVVVTFYVECWNRNDGDKTVTFASTHTHELHHETSSKPLPQVDGANIISLHIVPKIDVSEETKAMLDQMQQSLYDHHHMKGVHCSVKYKLDIPGLPMRTTLISGIKYDPTITSLVIASIFLVPIYMIYYRTKTKFIQHEVVKHVIPSIKDAYPSAPVYE